MSTPQPPATAGPHDGERRKSLGKYVKRMSSVFKREKSGRGVSTLSSVPSEPTTSAVEQQQSGVETETETAITDAAATQAVAQAPAQAESTRQEEPTPTESKHKSSVAAPAATDLDLTLTLTPTTSIHAPIPAPAQPAAVLDRNAMQRERARALFAKYGLTLEPHEFIVTSAAGPLVPRVEKPIRMRVHRSCHQCGTLYGHDKVCVQCEHRRCKQCPKYPKKKTSAEKGAAKEDPEQPRKKKLLTVTTRYGKELAYQPATQRVRRTCHKCDALFSPATATTCESCNHLRCTKCPREPAKRNKWPAGYPGDAEPESEDEADAERAMEQFRRIWRKPRRIVRWECEQCHSLFRQGSHLCPGCGHERCDDCSRSPIKKPRSEESFDPAVVAAVEAKLRALGVDSTDDAPSSEPEHR